MFLLQPFWDVPGKGIGGLQVWIEKKNMSIYFLQDKEFMFLKVKQSRQAEKTWLTHVEIQKPVFLICPVLCSFVLSLYNDMTGTMICYNGRQNTIFLLKTVLLIHLLTLLNTKCNSGIKFYVPSIMFNMRLSNTPVAEDCRWRWCFKIWVHLSALSLSSHYMSCLHLATMIYPEDITTRYPVHHEGL